MTRRCAASCSRDSWRPTARGRRACLRLRRCTPNPASSTPCGSPSRKSGSRGHTGAPERRGSTFPIPICRVVAPDHQVEQVVDRSGAPGEPVRPGILSGIFEGAYYAIEHSREKGVIQREGFLAPLREVAVIRGMPGSRGITLTSHVDLLVVRLHDILFLLPGPSATVDLCFSEHSFRFPSGWKEERLYSEDGFHFVDIAAPVEDLLRKLDMMRQQEDKETVEDRERRLLQEEVMRKQDEEEKKKICARKEEERRIREEEEAAKPPVYADPIWDAALWEINAAWRICSAHFNTSTAVSII